MGSTGSRPGWALARLAQEPSEHQATTMVPWYQWYHWYQLVQVTPKRQTRRPEIFLVRTAMAIPPFFWSSAIPVLSIWPHMAYHSGGRKGHTACSLVWVLSLPIFVLPDCIRISCFCHTFSEFHVWPCTIPWYSSTIGMVPWYHTCTRVPWYHGMDIRIFNI